MVVGVVGGRGKRVGVGEGGAGEDSDLISIVNLDFQGILDR